MNKGLGKGSQKAIRFQRLRDEIIDYVRDHPDCTAQDIVAYLAIDKKMRNHGLTARKVGAFIPRHCKELDYKEDSSSGKRVYAIHEE